MKVDPMSRNRCMDLLVGRADVVEVLGLCDGARVTCQQPNVMVEVRDLRASIETPPRFCLELEVSSTCNPEHLFRVTDHAWIVTPVTGVAAYPGVADLRLVNDLRGFVEDRTRRDVLRFSGERRPEYAYRYPPSSVDAPDWR